MTTRHWIAVLVTGFLAGMLGWASQHLADGIPTGSQEWAAFVSSAIAAGVSSVVFWFRTPPGGNGAAPGASNAAKTLGVLVLASALAGCAIDSTRPGAGLTWALVGWLVAMAMTTAAVATAPVRVRAKASALVVLALATTILSACASARSLPAIVGDAEAIDAAVCELVKDAPDLPGWVELACPVAAGQLPRRYAMPRAQWRAARAASVDAGAAP